MYLCWSFFLSCFSVKFWEQILEEESSHAFLSHMEQLLDSECTENAEEDKSWLQQIFLQLQNKAKQFFLGCHTHKNTFGLIFFFSHLILFPVNYEFFEFFQEKNQIGSLKI